MRRVCGDKLNSKKSQYIHFCLLSTDYVCKHKRAYCAQKLCYMSAFFPLSWSANKYETMGSNLNEAEIDFYTKMCALNLRDRIGNLVNTWKHKKVNSNFIKILTPLFQQLKAVVVYTCCGRQDFSVMSLASEHIAANLQ